MSVDFNHNTVATFFHACVGTNDLPVLSRITITGHQITVDLQFPIKIVCNKIQIYRTTPWGEALVRDFNLLERPACLFP